MSRARIRRRLNWSCAAFLMSGIAAVAPLAASSSEQVEREAFDLLQRYLRIDTTNPPGNESRAVDFFAAVLKQEGIAFDAAESAPGRGNIWARLRGGDQPGLVLLHHMDVVPADPRYWDQPPFSGVLDKGWIYGRGALDTKTLGVLQLVAFLELHRSGRPLRRDVLWVATADEEAGGFYGAGWMVEHRPEVFENVGWLLNEGGDAEERGGQGPVLAVEVTQKVPLWLHLVAHGTPGHGSTPRVESAVTRLVRALANLERHRFPVRLVPPVRTYLEELSKLSAEDAWLEDVEALASNPELQLKLQLADPGLHALLRNTCSITRLEGSPKINVVPPEASAELDCRLLPDQDPEEFQRELAVVLNEPSLEIQRIMVFSPAITTTDTDLYRAIESIVDLRYPGARVLPSVSTGFTDSHFFRDLGIESYGFDPVVIPKEAFSGVHGNNERVPAEAFRAGLHTMIELVEKVAVE